MNYRILIVDDDMLSIEIITSMLEHAGYDVFSACNGTEGLEIARSVHPDIILMDMQMPEMDGFHAVHEIMSDGHMRNIPVIGISAYASPLSRERAIRMGMAAFFSKPVNREMFIDQIRVFLPDGEKGVT